MSKSLGDLRVTKTRWLELTQSNRKYPHNGTLSIQNTKMLDMALYSFASTANPFEHATLATAKPGGARGHGKDVRQLAPENLIFGFISFLQEAPQVRAT